MAHPDLIKKFGFFPKADVQTHYEKAAAALAEAQVCLEINSSGLHKPIGEIYPSAAFLRTCLARSGGHHWLRCPQANVEVARELHRVKRAQETGCREAALFNRRRRTLQPLTF